VSDPGTAVVMMWLGGAGAIEFGGLWLVAPYAGALSQVSRLRLGQIIGYRRLRRISWLVGIAPPGTMVLTGLLVVGAVLQLTVSPR
jgi:hypothetical protein